jgi:hypothetical protein
MWQDLLSRFSPVRFDLDEHLSRKRQTLEPSCLSKKADVENHLAARLRKHHIPQGSTIGQISAEHSSAGTDGTVATSGGSQDPLNPSSEFVLPLTLTRRTLMLQRPVWLPRMIRMHRECPFCTSIQFNRSEGTIFDRMLHVFAPRRVRDAIFWRRYYWFVGAGGAVQ